MEKIIKRSSTDMYTEDQVKYAILVDRRRALPMVKDGLKLVQRRILYAAYKEGMTSFSKRQKCAALTGEVMKNFHPHCLDGDTKIHTRDGLDVTIREACEKNMALNIVAIDPNTLKPVDAIAREFRIGQYSTQNVMIQLESGFIIECTGNHMFMLENGEFVRADRLRASMVFFGIDKDGNMRLDKVRRTHTKFTQSKPMYDFTVYGYSNMLIPTDSENTNFICAHNSDSYSSIVAMTAWFKNKVPLIQGKGSFGNLSNDGAAAQRYTECSLSDFGYNCVMSELAESQNIVNWIDTYKRDGIMEPEYLPVKAPILLINGCQGIGVGLAINIPPHNLSEVIDATLALIKNPKSKVVLIPDTCQPCEIIDTDWAEISNTGSGKYRIRGKIVTTQDAKGDITLTVKSLPDNISTTYVYDKILDLVDKKQLPMVKDVFNMLDKQEMPNVIIQLRTGGDPEYMKQILYTKCGVQSNEFVNFEAVAVNGIDVKRYSYKDYLLAFIDQRMAIKFRLYCNKLQKAMTRYHYIDAFTKVLESGQIDKIIAMIKKSKDTEEQMVEKIIKMCKVTDLQAKYILNANLAKLSLANLGKYKEECKTLRENIELWRSICIDEEGTYIKNEIIQELKDIKAKYGSPRLCKVISKAEENNIPAGTFKVVVTERNFIRKVPDVDKVGVVRKDNPKFIIRVDNTENALFFDNKGKVFSIPVHKIPISDRNSVGTDVRSLIRNLTADIIAVFTEPLMKRISKSNVKHYLIVLTKSNTIKKLDIEDFLTVTQSGLIYSKIRPEDEIVSVYLAPHNLDVVICSDKKALRIKNSDIPLFKRNANGSRAMDTNESIEGMTVIYPESNYIVALTKNGKCNKFDISMFPQHARGRKGSNVMKLDTTDNIFGIYAANDSDIIRVITSEGVEEIHVADIKDKSPIAAGTKMISSKGVIVKADVIR